MNELQKTVEKWLQESPIPLTPLTKEQMKTLIIIQMLVADRNGNLGKKQTLL